MPKIATPLNDKQVKIAKPSSKDYFLTDTNGLRLLIKTDGTKLWESRYTSPTLSNELLKLAVRKSSKYKLFYCIN
mgnify:CR=1 FL=1